MWGATMDYRMVDHMKLDLFLPKPSRYLPRRPQHCTEATLLPAIAGRAFATSGLAGARAATLAGSGGFQVGFAGLWLFAFDFIVITLVTVHSAALASLPGITDRSLRANGPPSNP